MAGITHYINTASTEPTLARWPSLINDQPEPFPVLVLGDTRPHRFFFHYDGTIEDFSGNASYTLKVTIGDVSLGPVGGFYALTCGETTDSIPYNATADQLQGYLNGLATVAAAGNVTVTGTFPNFQVSWNEAGAQTALTASAIGLIPAGAVGVTTLQAGDSTHCQQSALQLRQNPITTQSTWTGISSPNNGWSGTLTTNTAEGIALLISQGEQIGNLWQYTTVLQAEVINALGDVVSYYQTQVILRASNLDVTSLTSTTLFSAAYPLIIYSKSVTVGTTGSPADIGTLTVPPIIARFLLLEYISGFVQGPVIAETAAGTLASATFQLWTGAGGTGTQLTGSASVTTAGTFAQWAANSGSKVSTTGTIYIRQLVNSANAGTVSFYLIIYPMP